MSTQGTIINQMTKRGGIITNTDTTAGWFVLESEVPLNEMFGYSGELRSVTQGKGEFTMEYARYSSCLSNLEEELIRRYQESQNLNTNARRTN